MAKKLIRFDWAMKTLLRDKANFDVLEGFLAALLNDEDIVILNLLESESNSVLETDKFNRVDLLVEDGKKRKIIIEIQNTRESDYLERMLYGTSKVIIENIDLGDDFSKISKVISVSILYFNLGQDNDYLYYGTTDICGMNTGNPLIVRKLTEVVIGTEKKQQMVEKNIFPEYYFINVEKYKNIINKNIDEWIYMLKNNEVKPGSTSKNIDKAEKKLEIINMTDAEREIYKRYMTNVAIERDMLETAREEGEMKGEAKGKIEGKIETTKEFALKLIKKGFSNQDIQDLTGLSEEEINKLHTQ